jgi:SNF2 family DNA or RNA helicase
MTKLMQYANGQVYDADKKVVPVHDAKLEALREIVREAGEPLLICYTFLSDRARLLAELPNAIAIDKNPATIDKWNRGEIPILLIHPLSAGHGLNLQHGGRRIIWYGPTWSLEGYMQANGRLHRQGQTKPVLVQHLVAKDTIDETIMHALSGKNLTQSALLAAMKHRVAAIREELEQA